jgi:Flp pilus assembly protein TadB
MSTSPATYPAKTINRRAGIRIRAAWRTYVRVTNEWVDSPAFFLATSYTSLVLTGFFIWNLLSNTAHFWPNVYNVLISGWAALLLSTLTLVQTKLIHRTIVVPVVGIFLAGASAFLYQDAKNATVNMLNQQFPFAVSQLAEAIDSGTRIAFALEIAAWGTVAVVVCYFILVSSDCQICAEKPPRQL